MTYNNLHFVWYVTLYIKLVHYLEEQKIKYFKIKKQNKRIRLVQLTEQTN